MSLATGVSKENGKLFRKASGTPILRLGQVLQVTKSSHCILIYCGCFKRTTSRPNAQSTGNDCKSPAARGSCGHGSQSSVMNKG